MKGFDGHFDVGSFSSHTAPPTPVLCPRHQGETVRTFLEGIIPGNPVVAVLGQALRNETASIITVIIHIMADNKNNLSQVIDVSYTATF